MLEAIELTKKYNNHLVLNPLNLFVNAGEIYCLLGKKGAGKTTLLNLFTGFVQATSGEARIDGEKILPNNPSFKGILAYIPQFMMLCKDLTCFENVDFFSKLAGFSYTAKQVENFLTEAGLSPYMRYQKINCASIAVNQKMGLAIALARNAKILLMDDPTGWLDNEEAAEFFDLIKSFADRGKTVLMATKDIFNASNLKARIGIMHHGSLIEEISAADINSNDLLKLYYNII
ncbi:ABC-2 type transport system ATP-binding protein [Pedobacter sp. UYP30]|uniref:ABC transporter ATP-binding protein n=1 Tax=Pedobacter sp. UYP30 TaxID=1756400 RepID=UPI0033919E0A